VVVVVVVVVAVVVAVVVVIAGAVILRHLHGVGSNRRELAHRGSGEDSSLNIKLLMAKGNLTFLTDFLSVPLSTSTIYARQKVTLVVYASLLVMNGVANTRTTGF